MKLILITGKTGSGKNKLGELLSYYRNFEHIDVDKICHTCYENEYIVNKVKEYFGEDIVKDNIVDRKKLGGIVFNSKEKMAMLTDLTYNYVINKIDEIIKKSKKTLILNYVLLPNTKYWKDEDAYKILVKCRDDKTRYEHLIRRDNVSMDYILSRDSNSLNYIEEEFDYVFENDYTQKNLIENVERIIKEIDGK